MSAGGNDNDAIKRAPAARRRVLGCSGAWSIETPQGWEHEVEKALDTFFHPDGSGVLHISSITKSQGGEVSDADLSESIEDLQLGGVPRKPAAYGGFTGYTLIVEEESGSVRHYWLMRAGRLVLFVTFFGEKQDESRELAAVMKALASLRPA